MPFFSDALDREAAWLNTIDDSLPILISTSGGPFQIIQARWPRQAAMSKSGLYVTRSSSNSYRYNAFASQRARMTTQFALKLLWPINQGPVGAGSGEAGQLAFEQAIDLVVLRVAGLFMDKTHGGAFLSAAENPPDIYVDYDDPEQGITNGAYRASIKYSADDPELIA